MLKKCLLLASVWWGISSSVEAVTLSLEESKDLETLQKLTPMVKQNWDEVKAQVQKEQKTFKNWFLPLDERKLEKLIKLSADQKAPLPDNIYPKPFSSEQSPNLRDYALQIAESYKPEFFLEEMNTFMDAFKEKKSSNGKGLIFEDMGQLQECQMYLNNLGRTLAEFLPAVESSRKIYKKFSNKLNTLYLVLQESDEKGYKSDKTPLKAMKMKDEYIQGKLFLLKEMANLHIEPSLKTANTTFEEEFIKTKLFYDAASSTFEASLNVWGNIAMLNAHKYREHGDGSLISKLPKLHKK